MVDAAIEAARKKFVLSKGEYLLIKRRRSGLTQEQVADTIGVSLKNYRAMEKSKDRETCYEAKVLGLSINEMCMLWRRRKNWTQTEMAARLGCTKQWIIMMEDGQAPCGKLATYWGL